jgi:hypothetical protein
MEAGGAGGGTSTSFGPVWIIKRDVQKVAVLDGAGSELFAETVSSPPKALTIDGADVWIILEGGEVLRYDAQTHAKKATIKGAKNPQRIAAAAGGAWVVDKDGSACGSTPEQGPTRLLRIDGTTDTVSSTTNLNLDPVVGSCDEVGGLTANAQGAYAILDNGFGVMRVANDGKVADRVKLGAESGYGIGTGVVTGTTLWVVERGRKRLLDLDPTTLATRATTTLPDDVIADVVTASDKAVWISSTAGMLRVDATATSTTKSLALEGSAVAVARSTRGLYVAGGGELGAIVILDATTGEKKGEIPLAYADDVAVP